MKLNKTSIPPGGSVTPSPEETDTQKRLVLASTVTCLSCSEHNKQTTRLKKHDTHKLSHFCTKIVFVFLYRKRDITARQRPNQCTTAWSKATEASSHINKSVFSLLHRLSTWRYLHLLLSIDGTDIRTDGRTDAQPLCRPCSAYLAGASITFSHDSRNSSDYAKLLNRFKF